MGSGWLVMFLVLIVCTALLIAVVVALLRAPRDGSSAPSAALGHPSAADRTLDERYARGDIDEVEYRQRKSVLHSG